MHTDDMTSGFVADSSFFCEAGSCFTALSAVYASASGPACLYRALRYGRLHMLKALKPAYASSPVFVQALRKEFSIGYQLEHPNICRTLGWEQVDGLGNCIVMEYVDGQTLTDLMKQGRLTPALARKLLKELCSALQYLHDKQLVHRDVKPDNILVTYNGNNLKLIDFGLSDGDDYSLLKEPAGTRHYLAPEMLEEGARLDLRADIYSLGVVMGEMAQLLHDRRLARVSRRCTGRRPESRYASAMAVAQALEKRDGHGFRMWPLAAAGVLAAACAWFWLARQTEPLLPAAYGNLAGGGQCRELVEAERMRLQGLPTLSDSRQRQRDSLRLMRQIEEALRREFPLTGQQASPTFRRLLEVWQREAAGLYSDVSSAM